MSTEDIETATPRSAVTRASIASVAAAMFAEAGYAGTSLRSIASAAGVDPALVVRYFGSKERLFLETMNLDGFFTETIRGPLDDFGERLVAHLVEGDFTIRRRIYSALLRASDSEHIQARLRRAMETNFIAPLAPRLRGPHAELRARLVAAQISGLLTSLAIVCDERIQQADRDVLIRTYGRAIQSLIDDPGTA